MPPPKSTRVYQLKITLKDVKPPIWRRILIDPDTRLDRLHHILQITMGWDGGHLHAFLVGSTSYGDIDPNFGMGEQVKDQRRASLGQVAPREKSKLIYQYDFGDSWEHDLVVEKVLPIDPATTYPVCVAGVRACPPEDCGGVWGYAELLRIIKDPTHPEHEERMEWLGGGFDPKTFDLDAINRRLTTDS
jgi:hypothetical protein